MRMSIQKGTTDHVTANYAMDRESRPNDKSEVS